MRGGSSETQRRYSSPGLLPAVPLGHRHHGSGRPGVSPLPGGGRAVLLAGPAPGRNQLRRLAVSVLFLLRREPLPHRPGSPSGGRPSDTGGLPRPSLGGGPPAGRLRSPLPPAAAGAAEGRGAAAGSAAGGICTFLPGERLLAGGLRPLYGPEGPAGRGPLVELEG